MNAVAIHLTCKDRAVRAAAQRLETALRSRGWGVADAGAAAHGRAIHLLLAPPCDQRPAESYAIEKVEGGVRVVGADDRALAYGIRELTGQVESSPLSTDWLDAVGPTRRAPFLAVRSLCVFTHNRQLEEEWIYSRDHWERYFELLSHARYNMFTLTFGHQTSYLAPPFPFMLDVPGYGRVRARTYSDADRARNLEMLRMVSALAKEWGLRFVLGIWQQHAHKYGENLIDGLTYDDLFDYCPRGLAALLKECPDIAGVQFRMNSESGIEEDDQERFFSGLLGAIRERRDGFWVDLRAKGLRQETIDAVVAMGFDVVVSTKFWSEHMALPHFACRTNPLDAQQYRRYGYWDLLRRDRNYKMLYRLWSVGTQKILTWCDIEHARRFAETCRLFDGIGFEICAPLSNKGYGNLPGGKWRVFAERSLECADWEFERYWGFIMPFGLAGYCADVSQPALEGEFARRFGRAAGRALKDAYEAAGGILPLITAAHASSASTFGMWTEMHTGGLLDGYAGTCVGDVERFRNAADYVEDLLAGRDSAKLGPLDVALRLTAMADAAETALLAAPSDLSDLADRQRKEYAAARRDLAIQCALARYHAAKMRAAVDWMFFRRAADRGALSDAVRFLEEALKQWERIVALTDGVFYGHMVFQRLDRQVGHWKDELPYLRHDLERLREVERLFDERAAECDRGLRPAPQDPAMPWHTLEHKWEIRDGTPFHWAGEKVAAEPLKYPVYGLPTNVVQDPAAVVREALAVRAALSLKRPSPRGAPGMRPSIFHDDLVLCRPGRDIRVRARIVSPAGLNVVRLHYRRQVQSENWTAIPMCHVAGADYEGVIPGAEVAPKWNMMYAIEVIDNAGGGVFYPDMDARAPYVIVKVEEEGR